MKANVVVRLFTWFIFAQSTLTSYHTEAFVKTEVGCTVLSLRNNHSAIQRQWSFLFSRIYSKITDFIRAFVSFQLENLVNGTRLIVILNAPLSSILEGSIIWNVKKGHLHPSKSNGRGLKCELIHTHLSWSTCFLS